MHAISCMCIFQLCHVMIVINFSQNQLQIDISVSSLSLLVTSPMIHLHLHFKCHCSTGDTFSGKWLPLIIGMCHVMVVINIPNKVLQNRLQIDISISSLPIGSFPGEIPLLLSTIIGVYKHELWCEAQDI